MNGLALALAFGAGVASHGLWRAVRAEPQPPARGIYREDLERYLDLEDGEADD